MAGRHKGCPKTGGRQKGTPNKIPGELKAEILEAARLAGGEGGTVAYLQAQAGANPSAFLSLLGRVLPLQVGGDPNNPVKVHHVVEQHIVEVASEQLESRRVVHIDHVVDNTSH